MNTSISEYSTSEGLALLEKSRATPDKYTSRHKSAPNSEYEPLSEEERSASTLQEKAERELEQQVRVQQQLVGEKQNYSPIKRFGGMCGSAIVRGDDGRKYFAKTFHRARNESAQLAYEVERRVIPVLAGAYVTPALVDVGLYEPLIVQELIDGHDLETILDLVEVQQPDAELVRKRITPLLRAGQRMHNLGIVHRDLKPLNIMIPLNEGEPNYRGLKIVDFGLARDGKTNRCFSHGAGTPLYQSPEQLDGIFSDERSDIYAAGVILHQMLTEKAPFAKMSEEDILFVKQQDSLDPAYHAVVKDERMIHAVRKATAPSRHDRFESFAEMEDAIKPRKFWTFVGDYLDTKMTRRK